MLIRQTLIAMAVVGSLGATDLAVGAGPPNGLDVNVVNPNPIPVTGSVTVNGSVTGTVTGTVGLTAGTSVKINNTIGDPVRVRNVNDAIQPVQKANNCSSPANTVGCSPAVAELYKVPDGKRLVIEFVSFEVCSLPGQTATLHILTTVGGGFVDHTVGVTPPAAGPGTTSIGCNSGAASSTTAVGKQVRLYADAGSSVNFEGDRNSALGTSTFSFAFSGYLVDVPLSP